MRGNFVGDFSHGFEDEVEDLVQSFRVFFEGGGVVFATLNSNLEKLALFEEGDVGGMLIDDLVVVGEMIGEDFGGVLLNLPDKFDHLGEGGIRLNVLFRLEGHNKVREILS